MEQKTKSLLAKIKLASKANHAGNIKPYNLSASRVKYLVSVFAFAFILIATGCSNDKDIKAQITDMAKSDVNFAGVGFTVDGKVVTLTGNCPSKKEKDAVEKTIKGIKVVNGINNQIVIAPVILDTSFATKLAVDSVLAAYPTVTANVIQSKVILTGKVEKSAIIPLLNSIKKKKTRVSL